MRRKVAGLDRMGGTEPPGHGGGAGHCHPVAVSDLEAQPFIRPMILMICPLRTEMYFPETSRSGRLCLELWGEPCI